MSTDLATQATLQEANARAERIRQGLESYAVLREDLAAAYLARDWHALGYESWDRYVEAEFTAARLALPREERRELVAYFREQGMSTRAIAAATGVSREQVRRDTNVSPAAEPSNVVGIDGKTYTPRQAEPEVVDAEIVEDQTLPPITAEEIAELREVETRPQPDSQARRRPITDQSRDAGWELRKAIERIERIAADDRFTRNKNEVAAHLRGHLINAVEVCQDLLDRLNVTEEKS